MAGGVAKCLEMYSKSMLHCYMLTRSPWLQTSVQAIALED